MNRSTNHDPSDKPPVFANWSGWYVVLILVLVVQLVFYFFLTRFFE